MRKNVQADTFPSIYFEPINNNNELELFK